MPYREYVIWVIWLIGRERAMSSTLRDDGLLIAKCMPLFWVHLVRVLDINLRALLRLDLIRKIIQRR